MARIPILGTKTDWSVIRGYLNSMFIEIYASIVNITNKGNTFNGANQLVELDANGKLPAIDGSQLTNLPIESREDIISAIGFEPENETNKVTAFQTTPDDTHYPSEKLVKDSFDSLLPLIYAGL